MKLETERLILRDLKDSDAKDITREIKDIEVSKYLLVVPHPYKLKDAKSWIADCKKRARKKIRGNYSLAILDKKTKKFLGVLSLMDVDRFQETAEPGCWLGKDHWRKGIMKEAMIRIMDFAFNELKLRRLNVYAFKENKGSNALVKRLGFINEGMSIKKSKSRATGKIHDDMIYGMLKSDWENAKKKLK